MNKYERIPDEIVDLHGFTRSDAEVLLRALPKTMHGKHVRIITGTARGRESGPVIRPLVKAFLVKNKIAYAQSKIYNGGDGAFEVYL